jgi:hypothetical protein
MKRESAVALSIATAALSLLIAQFASAQAAPGGDTSSVAMQQAMQMVPAQASLSQPIDARKVNPGDQVKATLTEKIQLKNGTDLPSGTQLTGQITVDQIQNDGTFSLALAFTNAELKNGKVIPIKATIMKVFVLGCRLNYHPLGFDIANAYPITKYWTGRNLQVDQHNALDGVDLQSRIADSNSGNFVSKKKDEIRLSTETVLEFAIAAQGNN